MNDERYTEQKELVNNFLEEVKKKLPFWLRDQPGNIKDILDELENHIWDKAFELSASDDPSPEFVHKAIVQMGSPSQIATEYKRRGKPKIFITEELFPLYYKALILIGVILFAVNIIGLLASISRVVLGEITVGRLFSGFFSGLILSLTIGLILITLQFVYLSLQGYLPEDFRRMTHGKIDFEGPIFSLKKPFKAKTDEQFENGYTNTLHTSEKLVEDKPIKVIGETKVVDYEAMPKTETHYIEEKVIIREKVKEPKQKARYYQGKDYLSDGIAGIVFGIIVVILVYMPFLDFLPQPLKIWITIFGVLAFALGIVRFIQALVGRIQSIQIGLLLIGIIPQALEIPLWYALLQRPEILYNWLNTILHNHIAFADQTYYIIFTVVVWIVIVVHCLAIFGDLIRIIKVAVEGFPER